MLLDGVVLKTTVATICSSSSTLISAQRRGAARAVRERAVRVEEEGGGARAAPATKRPRGRPNVNQLARPRVGAASSSGRPKPA